MKKKDKDKNKESNLEVFQARTDEMVMVKPGDLISKIQKYKDGSVVWVTDISTAQGRTYRLHEGQHLNHDISFSPKSRLSEAAKAGIQDVLLHTKCMPDNLPVSVIRDEKATAFNDLRLASYIIKHLRRDKKKIPPTDLDEGLSKWWNYSCIVSLRAKAILGKKIIPSIRKHKFKLPPKIERTLNSVLSRAKRGRALDFAGKKFERILVKLPDEPDYSMRGMPSPGDDDGDFEMKLPFMIPFGRPRPAKTDAKPDQRDGKPGPQMPYQELEMTVRTAAVSHTRNYRTQSFGSQPDQFRLARASFSPVTNLFKVKLRKQESGGTFLLDASGSMGIRAAGLSIILEKLPTATVAFYSGTGLTVYAKGGKRYAGTGLRSDGANCWDHQALQWLLKQKQPYFFVTDESFCSDRPLDPGQEIRAHVLLEQVRSKITMYNSYSELLQDIQSGELLKAIKR